MDNVARLTLHKAHNHPSGNLTPSQADIDLTRKLKEAGKPLELAILDHILLTGKPTSHLPMKGSCEPFSRIVKNFGVYERCG